MTLYIKEKVKIDVENNDEGEGMIRKKQKDTCVVQNGE